MRDSQYDRAIPNPSEYITPMFDSGTLGGLILPRLHGVEWRGFLPPSISADRLSHLETGGLLGPNSTGSAFSFGPAEARVQLAERLRSHLAQASNRIALLANTVWRPESDWIAKKKASTLTFGDGEVYHVVTPDDPVEAIVREIQLAEFMPYFYGAIGELDVRPAIGSRLLDAQIQSFVQSVSFVFASAYDGETYIFAEL